MRRAVGVRIALVLLILLLAVPAVGRAATFVQTAQNFEGFSQGNVTVALTGVGAGNLIVLWTRHSGGTTTYSASDGTSTFANGTEVCNADLDLCSAFAYLLVGNSGNLTFTMTFGASLANRGLHVWEFSYTGTLSFVAQNTGSGNSTALTTGNITTTGTDEIVLGASAQNGTNTSNYQINGVAAAGSQQSANATDSWYRLVTSPFTGNATADVGGGGSVWDGAIIAFKATGAVSSPPSRTLLGVGK